MSSELVASTTKPRISWIDALKGFAILTVVYIHNYNGYQTSGTYVSSIIKWVTAFHMTLFFACSGFFFSLPDSKAKIADQLKKKVKTLIIPYVIWGIVIGFFVSNSRKLIQGIDLDIAGTLIDIVTIRTSFLASWFIWVLFGVYCIQYLLALITIKSKKRTEIWICVNILFLLVGYISSHYFDNCLFRITQIITSCFFFMFGAVSRQIVQKFSAKKLWLKLTTGIACLVIGTVLSFVNGKVTYSAEQYGNLFLHTLNACLFTFGFFILFSLIYQTKILKYLKRFLEFMGQNSIIVLFTHSIFIFAIRFLEKILGMPIHTFPGLLSLTFILIIEVVFIKLFPKKLLWIFGK